MLTVFTKTFDAGGAYSSSLKHIRLPITPIGVQDGSQVRLLLIGHPTEGQLISGVSIGERSGSTANFVTTPTRVTFGGSNTVTLAAGTSRWSDWITFAWDHTKSYLVHVYLADANYTKVKHGVDGDAYNDSFTAGDYTLSDTAPPLMTTWDYFHCVGEIQASYGETTTTTTTTTTSTTTTTTAPLSGVFLSETFETDPGYDDPPDYVETNTGGTVNPDATPPAAAGGTWGNQCLRCYADYPGTSVMAYIEWDFLPMVTQFTRFDIIVEMASIPGGWGFVIFQNGLCYMEVRKVGSDFPTYYLRWSDYAATYDYAISLSTKYQVEVGINAGGTSYCKINGTTLASSEWITDPSEYLLLGIAQAPGDALVWFDNLIVRYDAFPEGGTSSSTSTSTTTTTSSTSSTASTVSTSSTSSSTSSSTTTTAPPLIYGPFPTDWDDADNWVNMNVRFIIPATKLRRSGTSIRIGLAYYDQPWSFDSMYIGHPATSGDAYDFNGGQQRVTFGGANGGTVVSGGLVSDWIPFTLNPKRPLILSFFISAASASPVKKSTNGYDLYYKTAADESGTTNVSNYTRSATYYLRRFVSFIESSTFTPTTTTTTSTSSTTTTTAPPWGYCWGEQYPVEPRRSWQEWMLDSATICEIMGDPAWGKLRVHTGTDCYGPVVDTGTLRIKRFTVQKNKYGIGTGTTTVQVRGSASLFTRWDISPTWETYPTAGGRAWRYVQMRMVKS